MISAPGRDGSDWTSQSWSWCSCFADGAGEPGDEESGEGPGEQAERPSDDGEGVAWAGVGGVAAGAGAGGEQWCAQIETDADLFDPGARGRCGWWWWNG